ncbi:hypothetical protein C3941_08045 [Kaistia algarum]|uniref:glycosyltransferase n=1 Tax=Kaistia algarum TaxID=2083279 RepID=UPI000CE7D662|nr:glycosyltransferase [Kaistia algarum]MCX5512008.1 glycosyltransferase [Kaistia algarum]PPE80135.1 hypothetical protein C3941_08045 [Kaistia algarum]
MNSFFVDATVPLRWGPHPVVGIPRVEFAIVRQALREKSGKAAFFKVERSGEARLLDSREMHYLVDLVEGRLRNIEDAAEQPFLDRLGTVARAIRDGAAASGKEFDRVSASYLSGRTDRRGLSYQASKALIRGLKLTGLGRSGSRETRDPLSEPGARCFLSTAGLHYLASSKRSTPLSASISTVLHDLIPIEKPHLTDRSHARNFARDVEWMFNHCRQIIGVSNYTAQQASLHAEGLGLEQNPRIAVSQLGSFLKASMQGRELEPVPSLFGRNFALYCSTIEIRKNHILLLKLWASLLPELGDRLPKLVFCGRWGWMYDEVKAYLASHPQLAEHVVILSDMSDAQLAWLYRSASFGLYPSLAEGWGLGAAESLDFGLPIIVSDTPSLGEATQGLMPVCPVSDMEAWRTEVRKAATDPCWGDALRDRIRRDYRPIDESAFAMRLLSLVQAEAPLEPSIAESPASRPEHTAGSSAPIHAERQRLKGMSFGKHRLGRWPVRAAGSGLPASSP